MDAGRLTQKNKKNMDVTSSDPMPNVVVLVLGAATCRAVWRGRRIQRTGTRRRSNEGRDDQTNPTLANNNAASKYIVVPTIIPEDKKFDRVDDHGVESEDAVTHVRRHDQPVDVHQDGYEETRYVPQHVRHDPPKRREPVVIEYLKNLPNGERLLNLSRRWGISGASAREGTPYVHLGLADPKWTDCALIDFILAYKILSKRPIVVTLTGHPHLPALGGHAQYLPNSDIGSFVKESGDVRRSGESEAHERPHELRDSPKLLRFDCSVATAPRLLSSLGFVAFSCCDRPQVGPINAPPAAATTMTDGNAFHAVNNTKQESAKANWRGPTNSAGKGRVVKRRTEDLEDDGHWRRASTLARFRVCGRCPRTE